MDINPMEPDLTDEQNAELDRRLADDDAAPNDALAWEDVQARALSRIHDRGPTGHQPVQRDDDLANDLIEHNPAFRALLKKSLASGRAPFPFADSDESGIGISTSRMGCSDQKSKQVASTCEDSDHSSSSF